MSISNRVSRLEQRPQPQRPHGMTHQELDLQMSSMALREVQAFVKTMTDDDLDTRIDYLKAIEEQQHDKFC